MNWGERGGCDTNTPSTTGPTSLWLPLPKGAFPSWPPVLSDKPSTRSAWEMQVIGSDTRAGEGGRGRANLDTGPSEGFELYSEDQRETLKGFWQRSDEMIILKKMCSFY